MDMMNKWNYAALNRWAPGLAGIAGGLMNYKKKNPFGSRFSSTRSNPRKSLGVRSKMKYRNWGSAVIQKRKRKRRKGFAFKKKKRMFRLARDLEKVNEPSFNVQRLRTSQINVAYNQVQYATYDLFTKEDCEWIWDQFTVLFTGAGGTGYDDGRINVSYAKLSMTLKNQSNTDCRVKVYYIVRKKGQDQSEVTPLQCMTTSNTQDTAGTVASVTTAITNPATNGTPGIYPTDYHMFNRQFRVTKIESFIMEAGAIKDLALVKKNVTINGRYVDEMDAYSVVPEGQIILLRFEGTPTHDKTTTTNVGTSSPLIDIVYSERYTLNWDPVSTYKTIAHRNELSSITAGRQAADETMADESTT